MNILDLGTNTRPATALEIAECRIAELEAEVAKERESAMAWRASHNRVLSEITKPKPQKVEGLILNYQQIEEMKRAQNWRINNREAILGFVNSWLDEQARFLDEDRVIEIRLRVLLTTEERRAKRDDDYVDEEYR